MELVAIVGNESLIRGKKLWHHCGEVKLLTTGQVEMLPEEALELLLLLPDAVIEEGDTCPLCRQIILPEELRGYHAKDSGSILISYGLSEENHLYLGEIREDSLEIILGKTILTRQGQVVNTQSILLTRKGGESHLELLGFTALLLVCGLEPQDLKEAMDDL